MEMFADVFERQGKRGEVQELAQPRQLGLVQHSGWDTDFLFVDSKIWAAATSAPYH
jgi:hypothetical protein